MWTGSPPVTLDRDLRTKATEEAQDLSRFLETEDMAIQFN